MAIDMFHGQEIETSRKLASNNFRAMIKEPH
jgi:hypothetical protein